MNYHKIEKYSKFNHIFNFKLMYQTVGYNTIFSKSLINNKLFNILELFLKKNNYIYIY